MPATIVTNAGAVARAVASWYANDVKWQSARLRDLQRRLQMGVEELANLLGVHRSTVSRWLKQPEFTADGFGADVLSLAFYVVDRLVDPAHLGAAVQREIRLNGRLRGIGLLIYVRNEMDGMQFDYAFDVMPPRVQP